MGWRARAGEEWAAALLATQFLTRLPIPAPFSELALAAAPRYFAATGLLVGALGAGALLALEPVFGQSVAAILAIALLLFVTGGLHEDGLADTADGLGGGHTPERSLEIMRDSAIGSYGVLAIGITLALIAATLASLPLSLAAPAFFLSHSSSRAALTLAMATSRYCRSKGAGSGMGESLGAGSVLIGLGLGLMPALLLPFQATLGALLGLSLAHFATRFIYERKLGGYTGDCLGALQMMSALGVLLGVLATA